ncbi:hypothetical protein [Saccharibacillus sacchari]|uniref:Uncharacterized protein n=1 Tax=Saccharibacillus sacchari TaxID=456493 RepID=A0ACC6PBG6_9BACL
MQNKQLKPYTNVAVLLLCLLFVLLPDIRFAASDLVSPETELRHSAYHVQYHYTPPAAHHPTTYPDTPGLPAFLWLSSACVALVQRNLHADSRIPILCKHRMLRPLKFRCSFVALFRFAI